MANQLHDGRNVCLSEMILVNLYEYMGEGVTSLKNIQTKGNLLLSGPFWLLQLWLNAGFEACLPIHNPIDADANVVKNIRVEGMRLTKRYNFTPTMPPFSSRTCSPEWFTRKFPSSSNDKEDESVAIREAFLTPRVFSLRLNQPKIQVTLIAYQPNLVAREFGLIQIPPKPLYGKRILSFFTTQSTLRLPAADI